MEELAAVESQQIWEGRKRSFSIVHTRMRAQSGAQGSSETDFDSTAEPLLRQQGTAIAWERETSEPLLVRSHLKVVTYFMTGSSRHGVKLSCIFGQIFI